MRLVDAMARGDLDAADAAAAALAEPTSPATIETLGMLHLARGRFAQAADMLDRLDAREPRLESLRRYAVNMRAITARRRELLPILDAPPGPRQYEIDAPPGRPPTIVSIDPGRPNAQPTPVCGAGGDPAAHLAQLEPMLARLAPTATGVTLLGVGDGHLLKRLADEPVRTAMGITQPVVLIEPDVDLLRACLLLHDLSPAIEQERITWCVGRDWQASLERALADQPQLTIPTEFIRLSPDAADLLRTCAQIISRLGAMDDQVRESVERWYATRSADDFARAILGQADRPPRALLLTSRFTTVLQYSTRDTADALRRLGWETRVLIEEAPHLQITTRQVRQVLDELRPDMVIMLDHLRSESPGLFPPQLPFVCWIQDNLPNLTSSTAGRSVGPRDFILTCAGATYSGQYDYPSRQCLFLDKLTAQPTRPTRWDSDGDDLVFVSNASQDPRAMADQLAALVDGPRRALVRACTDAMLAVYDRGDHLHSYSQVRAIVVEAVQALGLPPMRPQPRERLVHDLFERINNALYRQQALGWAADAARKRGLTLALYGSGWQDHPRFADCARGPVRYGRPLEDLTRRARINLQIVPFGSLHQRLLDGLVAGGFFLVREHPIDLLMPEMVRLIRDLPDDATDVAAARKALQGHAAAHLEDLLRRYDVLFGHEGADMIALTRLMIRQRAEARFIGLPERGEVSFRDQPTLEALLDRYLDDPAARQRVRRIQCDYVERNLTYVADLPRLLGLMAELLFDEARRSDGPAAATRRAGGDGGS